MLRQAYLARVKVFCLIEAPGLLGFYFSWKLRLKLGALLFTLLKVMTAVQFISGSSVAEYLSLVRRKNPLIHCG